MTPRGEGEGSVTALGALFSSEETLKVSKRVNDAIADHRRELNRLQSFAADNSALAKLVRQLPDDISHDIMVPFGSADFFPGQLIHTNEFLVLLGDGYYAERTSKQTVEILKRREKSLDSQIEALKASLLDLEAEAKFFDLTAAEAEVNQVHEYISGGIVEIREEYTEEPQAQQKDIVKIREEYTEEPKNASESDDEHARIMARLDEFEKEETEAESAHSGDEDEDPQSRLESESASGGSDEDDDLEAESTSGNSEDEGSDTGFGSCAPKNNVNDDKGKTSVQLKSMEPMQKSSGQELLQSTAKPMGSGSYQNFADHPSISNPNSKFHGGGMPPRMRNQPPSSRTTGASTAKSAASSQPVSCNYCHKGGHVLEDCWARLGVCLRCGSPDHKIVECPRLRKGNCSNNVTVSFIWSTD